MLKKLPIGIQDFSSIREGGYLYVDKTAQIHRMLNTGRYYFLSRPRRFGKSLTLSTIKEIFQGKRELFKGLWIEDQWDWTKNLPVVHISFSSMGYQALGLEQAIEAELNALYHLNGLVSRESGISRKFKDLFRQLSAKGRVVLLIDEYDKPIIDYLDRQQIPQAKAHQQILKAFYGVIKDSDPYIEFTLITGVSKFSKVSVFSDLNNLEDITVDWRYATLTGYTADEMVGYFREYHQSASKHLQMDAETLSKAVAEWYNGYSWDGKTFVYNPFSILNFYQKSQFQNYWFGSGTPSFLIKILRERDYYQVEGIQADQSIFENYTLENLESRGLLFQTGYLTIKNIDEYGIYTLDYPNKEVRESMYRHLIGAYSHDETSASTPLVLQLRSALVENQIDQVINMIMTLFKNIPSQIFLNKAEAYYHSLVYLTFKYLGSFVESEVNTADGRIDAVVITSSHVYIFEFKLDRSAKEAIDQIRKKGYAKKYLHEGKSIVGIGINFSSKEKTVDEWESITLN